MWVVCRLVAEIGVTANGRGAESSITTNPKANRAKQCVVDQPDVGWGYTLSFLGRQLQSSSPMKDAQYRNLMCVPRGTSRDLDPLCSSPATG